MVNLDPNSDSVGLGDLTQQFHDILSGANSDSGNRNGDSDRVQEHTRLPSLIGNNNSENNGGHNENSRIQGRTQTVTYHGRHEDEESLITDLNEEINNRRSNCILNLENTGETLSSRHSQHTLQEHVQNRTQENSGFDTRV